MPLTFFRATDPGHGGYHHGSRGAGGRTPTGPLPPPLPPPLLPPLAGNPSAPEFRLSPILQHPSLSFFHRPTRGDASGAPALGPQVRWLRLPTCTVPGGSRLASRATSPALPFRVPRQGWALRPASLPLARGAMLQTPCPSPCMTPWKCVPFAISAPIELCTHGEPPSQQHTLHLWVLQMVGLSGVGVGRLGVSSAR